MTKFIFKTVLLLLALFLLLLLSLPDKNLHIVFCDVGQGDAILISKGMTEILVDGGPPNGKVLSCLSKHLPFWDREIEVVVNSHPQDDHFGGLIEVARRYKIDNFLRPDAEGTAASWKTLIEELENHNVKQSKVAAGNQIRFSSLLFDILNPPSGLISNELNDYSIVGKLSYGDFDLLLTGDIDDNMIPIFADQITPVEVLKVPHHGSKNGLTSQMLEKSHPKLAVISVGKNNRYGHPHEEALRLLGSLAVRTLRTDLDGEVEIISDGKNFRY